MKRGKSLSSASNLSKVIRMRLFCYWPRILLLPAWILVSLYSCKPEVEIINTAPVTVWTDIYLRYLAKDEAYKVEVTLQEGDTVSSRKLLQLKGEVIFQNQPMQFRQLNDQVARYQLSYNGPFSSSATLKFNDPDWALSPITLQPASIDSFWVEGPLSKERGGIVTIFQPKMQAGESLIILVTDNKNRSVSIQPFQTEAEQQFQFEGNQLGALEAGTGTLYLVRKRMVEEQSELQSVRTLTEFYTDAKEVTIIE